jgi:hypothetical protein
MEDETFLKQILCKCFMLKKGVLIALFLVFVVVLAFPVLAEGEVDESIEEVIEEVDDSPVETVASDGSYNAAITYDWLQTEALKTSEIPSLAMSILALNDQNYEVANHVASLKNRQAEDEQCWPAGGCNVIDTSYALLALYYTGEDVTEGIAWLNSSLKYAPLPGQWKLVLKSDMNGTCKIGTGTNMKTFEIEDDKLKGTANSDYLLLNEIGIGNDLLPTINIDCAEGLASGANLVVALNFEKNSYEKYLVGGGRFSTGSLIVPNACLPKIPSSASCDYDSSLIGSWVLSEIGQEVNNFGTYTYLEIALGSSDLELGFLTRFIEASLLKGTSSLKVSGFEDTLINNQEIDGSWDSSVYASSVVSFALSPTSYSSEVTHSRDYLQSKWLPAGSWGTVRDTAWALIALSGKSAFSLGFVTDFGTGYYESICDDGIDDDADFLIDCDDGDCDEASACSDDYFDPDGGLEVLEDVDTETGLIKCSDGSDNDLDGQTDCSDVDCMDLDICASPSNTGFCSTDSDCSSNEICDGGSCMFVSADEESGGAGWIIVLIIILLLIGGGAYFYVAYVKTGKFKFKKSVSFDKYKRARAMPARPVINRPSVAARPTGSTVVKPAPAYKRATKDKGIEDELEVSLRKAEELLHGKK